MRRSPGRSSRPTSSRCLPSAALDGLSSSRARRATRTPTTCSKSPAPSTWVGAIVGWCRLDDPAVARRRLDELQARPKLRGIRHLIHQEPDPHWILRPAVAAGSRAARGPWAPARAPRRVPRPSRRRPDPRRTPRRLDDRDRPPRQAAAWHRRDARGGRSCSAPRPHGRTCTRRSPASTRRRLTRHWTADDLQPAVDVAVDAFGVRAPRLRERLAGRLLNGTLRARLAGDGRRRRSRLRRAASRSWSGMR